MSTKWKNGRRQTDYPFQILNNNLQFYFGVNPWPHYVNVLYTLDRKKVKIKL